MIQIMKMRKKLFYCLNLVLFVQLLLFISSCASSGVSSENKAEYKEMKHFQSSKQYLSALEIATRIAVEEPEAPGPKKFIHEHFDANMQITMQALANQPTTSGDAESQYAMYTKLVKIYANLSKMKLPLKQKKGKWSWTTPIKDYKDKKEETRLLAYKLLTNDAHNFIAQDNYQRAGAAFKKAIDNYLLNDPEKFAAREKAVKLLVEKANKQATSKDVKIAINAYHFYKTALSFDQFNKEATAGADGMKKTIATLYIAEGTSLEATNDIKNWVKAVDSYKNAYQWDKSNALAGSKKEKCVLRITDFYYTAGLKLEKAKKIDESIENYRLALQWTPNYKDCMCRMYSMKINCQLDSCTKYAAISKKSCTPMFTEAKKIKTSIDKSYNTISGIQNIVGTVEGLTENVGQLQSAVQPLSYLPVVGPVCKVVKLQLDKTHTKIESFSNKLSSLNKPVLLPLSKVLGSAKTELATNDASYKSYTTSLTSLNKMRTRIKPLLAKFGNNESKYLAVEKNLKAITATLKNMGNESTKATQNLKVLYKASNVIDNYEKYIKPASSAINKTKSVLDEFRPTLKSINSALDKEVGYKSVKVSIRKVLNGVNKYTPGSIKSGLKKAATKVLNPLLKKAGIKIPDIPYVTEATRLMDQAQQSYKTITNSVTNWSKSNKNFEANNKKMALAISKLNSIK